MSDIVIRGIGMPKDKQYSLTIFPNGRVIQHWDGVVFGETKAIELPQHGRLGDLDKLLPESGYDPMMFKPKYGGDHRTQYKTLMGYEILGIVEDAPIILEASKV